MMAALELRNMDEGIVRTMRRVMQTEMTWLKVLRHRVKDVRRDDLTRTITNLQAGLDGIDPYLEEDDP